MRPLDETRSRWRETSTKFSSFSDLQHSIKYGGDSSPCVSGCRSVCWKAFLLFHDEPIASWPNLLDQSRTRYNEQRDHFLKYIDHPELLQEVSIDPLADDPDSPWNTVREDEIIRGEIAQDVRRLPDEAFYHEEKIQTMILNILFVYCKMHPRAGGYRQGMHELLAPIVFIVDQDAVDTSSTDPEHPEDPLMVDVLDLEFVEQDSFALFSKIMERAQSFYEVRDIASRSALAAVTGDADQASAIVEKSKYIHEVCLAKVDRELAKHLKSIEILPQIFLIRWIRLLFGREFPFDQLLVLWDTIFAADPSLELIDLICVAMLLRIRWSLLEADYSVCLQLLLKYPVPQPPHGPHTFVADADYLRGHLNAAGGATLILKYTGKMPATPSASTPSEARQSTPSGQGYRQRALGGRAQIPSPSKFIQQQGGVEAIFQGAAKGVIERGERLGINQAVRDAMGEIRRNVQGFQDVRLSPRTARDMLGNGPSGRTVTALEKRNRQLAGMLEETVSSLKSVALSSLEDKAKTLELIEIAAAKVQFVKVYLEDSSMEVPAVKNGTGQKIQEADDKDMAMDDSPVIAAMSPITDDNAAAAISGLRLTDQAVERDTKSPTAVVPGEMSDAMDTSVDAAGADPATPTAAPVQDRPMAPLPTRSSLAQSSFSFMLEPDAVTPPSLSPAFPSSKTAASHRKRPSASRERNAFLFGEVTKPDEERPVSSEEIFGLEPIKKGLRSKNERSL